MSSAADRSFSVVDWCVFVASLIVCAAVGVYHAFCGQKQETAEHVLLANRKLSIVPVAMSLVASFMSTISILGYPTEIYSFGTMFCWFALTYLIVFPAAAFLFVPVFYQLKLTSAYEILYMAVVLYAPALALSSVSNLSIPFAILSTAVVGTFYTTLGGAKSVVWTSTIQMLLIIVGLLAVTIGGMMDLGGIGEVFEIVKKYERIQFDDFRIDPTVRHSFWSLVVGGTFTILPLFAANQMTIQRYISMPKLKNAQIAMLLNLPTNLIIITLYTMVGLVMFAAFHDCDPKKAGFIDKSDQLLPYYVVDRLHNLIGLPGLFLAALYSAGMSTLSSGLNSLSAVVYQDFIQTAYHRRKSRPIDEKHGAWITKFLSLGFGIVCTALAFAFTLFKAHVLQIAMSIFGMIGGPLLGTFILGMFVPFANSFGALVGQLISVSCTVWIGVGARYFGAPPNPLPTSIEGCNSTIFFNSNFTQGFNKTANGDFGFETGFTSVYRISYQYYGLLGVLVVLIVGSFVSLLTGRWNPPKSDNPHLFVQFLRSSEKTDENRGEANVALLDHSAKA